jgi:acyl phosphate:glycerol-3-phosphate acyltransferase
MVVYVVLAYLLAAVPFGLVVTTLYGGDADIRTSGSGNIGATNVARVYGWGLAASVVALDIAKGFVPVLLARALWPDAGPWWPALVLMTAFVAHCFPVYLEFRGGKGVATAAGGLLALTPWVALAAGAVWALTLRLSGRSSIAALAGTVTVVAVAGLVDPAVLPVVLLVAAGIVATHVPNIRRLARGEEGTVVRPVRWGRASEAQVDTEALLRQGPAGGSAAPAWKDEE